MTIYNIIVSVTFIQFLNACICVCENMYMGGGVRGKTCGDLFSFTMGVPGVESGHQPEQKVP